ncbi:unnamed protein product [Dibothriocephalus latus]|uniref:Uncharacterized protein n=1 Tax=Dibothriocephalus latus TaxID=60516 RepID=A0A3P7L6D4_DIBLA|nr:unnamed protein product [Dibothriocephalus latus]
MKFTFFTVVAAVLAAYHSAEAISQGFLTLDIAMTSEQLSSYLATLEPGIREFILAASMDGDNEDIESAVLHYLANDILEHEDMRDL